MHVRGGVRPRPWNCTTHCTNNPDGAAPSSRLSAGPGGRMERRFELSASKLETAASSTTATSSDRSHTSFTSTRPCAHVRPVRRTAAPTHHEMSGTDLLLPPVGGSSSTVTTPSTPLPQQRDAHLVAIGSSRFGLVDRLPSRAPVEAAARWSEARAVPLDLSTPPSPANRNRPSTRTGRTP